jgi:anti-sigma regulatory factor (Ser/Thr protein kinase)
MTAQAPGTGSGPGGPRPVPAGAGGLTPLGVFLSSGSGGPGAPLCAGGIGFAALRFDATPGSAARTRGFLRSTLASWQMQALVDDTTAVAAELVANAVTHALRPPPGQDPRSAWITLVRMDGAVVCAVADPSPALPAMSEPSPYAESGRGLYIVAELSDSWGHSAPAPAGKTVWARLGRARAGT